MKCFQIIIIAVFLSSCGKNRLELALKYAGDNRPELERVLSHYGQNPEDVLKYEAAKYLIENMPGHIYFDDTDTDDYFSKIDSLHFDQPFYIRHALYCLPAFSLPGSNASKQDIHYITSDFLIRHIDESFDLWQDSPWSSEVSFETFRDHLLPYRIGYEPLDRLMAFDERPDTETFNKIAKGNNIPMSATYAIYVNQLYLPHRVDLVTFGANGTAPSIKRFKIPDPIADEQYVFDCTSIAQMTKLQYNYAGIPNTIDYVPYWGRSNKGHHWNAVIDFHLRNITTSYTNNTQVSKVYRQTYHHNKTPKYNGKDYIPALFRNQFKTDVTDLYSKTKDIKIEIENVDGKKPDNVYLCVFNQLDWRPVAWGVKKLGKARFDNIAVGNVYLPVYYSGNSRKSFNYPFYLSETGDTVFLSPSKETTTLKLNRKYYTNPIMVLMNKTMIELEIIGIGDRSGTEMLLYVFKESDIQNAPYYNIELPKHKCRYVKIANGSTSYLKPTFAEITFLNAQNEPCPVKQVTVDNIKTDSGSVFKLFDGDKLTTFTIQTYITLDFGKEVELSGMNMTAWTDDNYINPGEEYELLYHDNQGWISLGRQIAENQYIEFSNAPKNSLYWLRNHTKGIEERPFTCENGKIIFW